MRLEHVKYLLMIQREEYTRRARDLMEMELAIDEALKTLTESDNLKERLAAYTDKDRRHLEKCFDPSESASVLAPEPKFRGIVELPWFCDPAKKEQK